MTRQVWTLSSPLESRRFAWLDKLADPVQQAVQGWFGSGKPGRDVKNWLNGTPLRHRVHPALIIWPLGAWTTAALLDVLDAFSSGPNRPYRKSADASVAFGIVGALPTAAAGVADWVDLSGHHRRVGSAHALLNTVALSLYAASYGLRLTNRRGAARATSGAGFGIVMLSGALGGELVYNLGVNVSWLLYPKAPNEYVDVLASGDLPVGQPKVVDVGRVPVMLLRREDQVLAVEAWCPHAGGPLDEGEFDGDVVQCPWHGSQFRLTDGRPLGGPASAPLRTFEVIERGGRIVVRPSYEGQDWP